MIDTSIANEEPPANSPMDVPDIKLVPPPPPNKSLDSSTTAVVEEVTRMEKEEEEPRSTKLPNDVPRLKEVPHTKSPMNVPPSC